MTLTQTMKCTAAEWKASVTKWMTELLFLFGYVKTYVAHQSVYQAVLGPAGPKAKNNNAHWFSFWDLLRHASITASQHPSCSATQLSSAWKSVIKLAWGREEWRNMRTEGGWTALSSEGVMPGAACAAVWKGVVGWLEGLRVATPLPFLVSRQERVV